MMTEKYLLEIESTINVLRRTIRALKRVIDVVDEDDIQKKFSGFLDEHESFLVQLSSYITHDVRKSHTPEAIIQFPLSTGELLNSAAKSEKQVIDNLDKARQVNNMPDQLSSLLDKRYQKMAKCYDYIQALADIWE